VINVLQLGRIDYQTALELQGTLVELRQRGAIGDTLLLLEHTPVITLGRNAKAENVLASREQLSSGGIELFECDRGGDVTYHGPGQLVAYPIFDLRGFSPRLGAVEFVRKLEEVLIRTCADFGIFSGRIAGLTGVWTRPLRSIPAMGSHAAEAPPEDLRNAGASEEAQRSSERKIAAIGVHISRGVTSHGFALNVFTDLDAFGLIVPCGIQGRAVTSLNRELSARYATRTIAPLTLDEVAQSAVRNFGVVFDSEVAWRETLDDLLRRPDDIPASPPEELRRLHEDDTFWA
jgi:lipoyl(octanoyl) transferase